MSATASTETSANGFTNGAGAKIQTNGTNGVGHHDGGEHEEMQYLNLIRRIIDSGELSENAGKKENSSQDISPLRSKERRQDGYWNSLNLRSSDEIFSKERRLPPADHQESLLSRHC